MISINGRARNGSNAVTVSGSACVIHHVAIKIVRAATRHADGSIPTGAGKKSIRAKMISPPQNPILSGFTRVNQSKKAGAHIPVRPNGSCADN